MIMFDLDVYEYNTDGAAALRKFRIGGYNYTGDGGRWVRQVAVYDGTGAINHKFKVHFGHDGTNCAIYISKVSATGTDSGAASSWSYSQANVSNFFGGYSSDTMAKWADGWDITWTTTLGTITLTSVVAPSHKQEDIVGIGTTSQSIAPNTVGAGHGLHIASDSFPELHLTNDTTGHASSAGANVQLNTNKLVLLNRETTGLIQAYTSATKLNFNLSSSESCFNEAGDDIDFRVEGSGNASLFFVNAGTDRVGIKTQSPSSDFEVLGTSHLRGNVSLGDASVPLVSQPIKVTEDTYFKTDVTVAGTGVINTLNVNNAFTFPTSDGSNTQVLVTDGTGSVTWQNQTTATFLVETVNGRLTLESGVAVSTTNQTAKTTLYFTPYKGNQIALYDGSNWGIHTLTQRSLSLSGYTADKNFDIFIYDNGGTLTLESVVWTNDTTRATALTTQDGVYVKNGATTRRYLGTIRTTSSTGQCEDSTERRFVWSYYNQVKKKQRTRLNTGGHTYSTGAWRNVNNSTTVGDTRYLFVVGLDTFATSSHNMHMIYMYASLQFDGETMAGHDRLNGHNGAQDHNQSTFTHAKEYVAAGYHYVQAVEYGLNSNSVGYNSQLLGDHLC